MKRQQERNNIVKMELKPTWKQSTPCPKKRKIKKGNTRILVNSRVCVRMTQWELLRRISFRGVTLADFAGWSLFFVHIHSWWKSGNLKLERLTFLFFQICRIDMNLDPSEYFSCLKQIQYLSNIICSFQRFWFLRCLSQSLNPHPFKEEGKPQQVIALLSLCQWKQKQNFSEGGWLHCSVVLGLSWFGF